MFNRDGMFSRAIIGTAIWMAVTAFAADPATAQRSVFVGENDAIGKTDRDYTNGFRQSFVYDQFSRDLLVAQVFDTVKPLLITAGGTGPARQQLEWIALAQSIFTPDKTTLPTRAPGDRPFGGWLYTGFNITQETGRRQLDSFEFLAGAVGGPASLAYDVQASFHRLLGQSPPVINGYEIHNEPGFLVAWDRRWKFGVMDFSDGYGIDIIPAVGFTGGNVFTYGSAGAIARFGRSLSTTWGPTMVRPSVSGASFVSPDPNAPFWGFDVFAGFEGRAVARNIFLDGNTYGSSPSVTRTPFVYDLIVGAEVFTQTGYGLSVSVVRRSREYTTQPGSGSTFGSFAASARF